MKVTDRIKKLELETFETESGELCHCPGEGGCNVLIPDLDKSDEDRDRERAKWLRPGYCEKCGKLIERELIEIVFVDGEAIKRTTISSEVKVIRVL